MKRETNKLLKTFYSLFAVLTLFFTSCYSWFENKVPMESEVNQVSLKDFFDNTVEVTTLYPPQQIFASQGTYADSIYLSWSSSQNATSYRIERAVVKQNDDGTFTMPRDDAYEILQKFVYSTNYKDKILSNPSYNNPEYQYLYFYRISADNISKGYESSAFTNSLSSLTPLNDKDGKPTDKYKIEDLDETSGCGWLFAPPSSLDAWKGKSTNEIQLTWKPVPNARYYKIYRGQNANGTNMEQIDSVLGNITSYSNSILESEQGIEFYYKICAQLSTGSDSAFSSLAIGYSLKPGAPSTPENVCTENSLGTSTSSIKVNWDAINYVPTNQNITLTYSLYRTSSVDSVYTLVKNQIDSATTTYTDSSGLKPGIYYYYYVQAVATDSVTGEKIKSSFSESGPEDTKTPAEGFLLSAPSSFEVIDLADTTKLQLRWSAAIGSEYKSNSFKYIIYSSETQEGPYTVLLDKISGTLNNDSYEITVEKKPFFKISTYSETASSESSLSDAVAPCPQAPANVKVTKNEKLSAADFIPNTLGVYPVKITWEKPSTDNPEGYHIYRSTSPNSDFRRITTEPVQELSFIDTNETAKAGIYYYYKVVSLNILGQGKYGNNPENDANARGYGMLTPIQFFREYNKTVMGSQKKLTLMHKTPDTSKIGKETINGDISGTLYYEATMSVPANIIMKYTDYCDAYIMGEESFGKYMIVNGNTDTKITDVGSKNGTMLKSTEITGMYRGTVKYDKVEIKGGAAGGGVYITTTKDSAGNIVEDSIEIDWKVGEEGRK